MIMIDRGFEAGDFVNGPLPVWLRGDDPIVLATSVCIHRNLSGFRFPHCAKKTELQDVCKEVLKAATKSGRYKQFKFDLVSSMSFHLRNLIYERRVAQPLAYDLDLDLFPMMLLLSDDETKSVVVNANDHIEARVNRPGFDLDTCFAEATELVDCMSLKYAKNDAFGYLTASPAIMTTGLEVEILMHIPGILFNYENDKWSTFAKAHGVNPDGFFGIGSIPLGNMFTFCNKTTHRQSLNQATERFNTVIPKLVEIEEEARMEDQEGRDDNIARALGVLKYAKTITFLESMAAISMLRLGMDFGLYKDYQYDTIKKLCASVFDRHLIHSTKCAPDNVDQVRSDLIRRALN